MTTRLNDGNDRLSRFVMNSELLCLARCRIIVSSHTSISGVRTLTRNHGPVPLVRVMHRLAEWTTLFEHQELNQVVLEMTKANAIGKGLKGFKLLDRKWQGLC